MRTLASSAASAILGRTVGAAVLVEMDLTTPLYLTTANVDLSIGGYTYYGTKGLGKISAAQTTPAEVKNLTFELSGAPSELLAVALSEPLQGKGVRLKLALYDTATYNLLDVQTFWQGVLDVPTINDAPGGSLISVNAEHAGIDLTRPASSYYSDEEQQRLFPGDPFFAYTSTQVDQRIVWPDKTYGRK